MPLKLQSSNWMLHATKLLKQKLGSPAPFPILTTTQIEQSLRVIQTLNSRADFERSQQKRAAVLVPILDIATKGPSILFTKRSSKTGTHANEISFPGGHFDEHFDGDSLYRTALRETIEELTPSQHQGPIYDFENYVQLLGHASTIPSMKGVWVTPIIGAFTPTFPDEHTVDHVYFPGNPSEVSLVFTVSIRDLIKSESSEPLPRLGQGNLGPTFLTSHGKIWGLTAIILRPILHQLLNPILNP